MRNSRRPAAPGLARRLTTALAALTVLWAGAAAAKSGGDTQSIVILHDNDLHGHLRSFCYIEQGRSPEEHCGVGGAARRATLIARLRRQARAPTVLVDAGDTSTRGPLATQYEGQDEVAAMNALGYDLAELGNNEFKLKDALDRQDATGAQASLQRLIGQSNFPWLCANATDAAGNLLPGVKPFVVRRMGRLRVAFLGLTTLKSVRYTQTRGLQFQDPVAAAKAWVPKARAEADVVVAVTHLGVDGDQALAKGVSGIDAIVGGDSHTFLYQPIYETSPDGRRIPIVQDGEFGANLGLMRLTFHKTSEGWRLSQDSDVLVPVSSAIHPSPRLARLVERYAAPLDVVVGQVGEVGADPAARRSRTAEVLAAAWRTAAKADIGMETEDAPYEVFRSKDATRYQVHAILPFHEDLVTAELTGEALNGLLARPARPFVGRIHLTLPADRIVPTTTYRLALRPALADLLDIKGVVDAGQETREALEHGLCHAAPCTAQPS